MQWFNQLKLATRLLVAFFAVLALTTVLGIFSIVQLDMVNQTSTEMEENWLPSTRFAGEINTDMATFRVKELQHILSTEEAEFVKYEKDLKDVLAHFEKSRDEYAKRISSPEERALYDDFKKNWELYLAQHTQVISLSRAGRNDEAKALIRGQSQKLFDGSQASLRKILDINIEGGKEASRLGDMLYDSSRFWIITLLLGAVVIGVCLALFIARSLVKQLGGEPDYAAAIATQIATGDLTVAVETKAGDKSSMLYAMKAMRDSLASIVGQVRTGTETIATASSQIAAGNHDLSSRTEEQASSLEETASSMEELTSTVKQNAENARQANSLATSASEVATKGGAVVSQVVDTMGSINESAKKIVDIIGVIDGIAFQTNILALNAAVEAARAGEQGRGFAVVATEVRNLAQRSAAAAKEIKALIGDSVEKVEVGTKLVDQAGATMDEVVASVRRVTDIISEIAAASHEQTSGIEQINQAISQMDEVTQQNASLVEEAAAASEAMQGQAGNLAQLVSVFKLDGNQRTAPTSTAKVRGATPKASAKPLARSRSSIAAPAPQARKVALPQKTAEDDWEEF
jgi:methyl-accepting chemotaxis protein